MQMAQFMPQGAIRVILKGFFTAIYEIFISLLLKPVGLQSVAGKAAPFTFATRMPPPFMLFFSNVPGRKRWT